MNPIQILVLQRGWVSVARVERRGQEFHLADGACISRWQGSLGTLAKNGPVNTTQLDREPSTWVHELTVIKRIDCNEEAWKAWFSGNS